MEHHKIDANGERFHVGIDGEGPPLYLFHGWPQTSHAWHRVVPDLAKRYTVVTPDIRGLGSSSRPASGYDARTLGEDVAGIAAALGHDEISVAGHDWGAMGAYSCAVLHPELVQRLAIYEFAMPGMGVLEANMVPKEGPGYIWHLGFQSVPDIAYTLMQGRERAYMTHFFRNYASDPTAISREDIDIYVDAMQQIGALRAGLEYYIQLYKMGEEVREFSKTKIDVPVMAYGGAAVMGDAPKMCMEMLANDVRGGTIDRAGHWVPEERPEVVTESLFDFVG
jgi:pimeloyl-ACP methyl ester carboxylesterase